MKLRTEQQWREWIEFIARRESKKPRYIRFYKAVDENVPNWSDLMKSPMFLPWAMDRFADSGSCVLDMLYALWDDPAWSSEHFGTLIRLFERDTSAHLHQMQPQPVRPPRRHLLSGRYEVLRRLGAGGNGEVFLAWSHETQSLYGLKVLKSELCADQAAVDRFKREIEAWVTIGVHPNVVRAYFLDVVDDTLYMTMDYVDAPVAGADPSLAARTQNGRVRDSDISTWFLGIADGLQHAYSCGITCHRDLKPANILITRTGVAKVTDFGLVSPLAPSREQRTRSHGDKPAATIAGALLGTPPYMSPEQFADASRCDRRSDIYSLGVALYQAASGGRLPFLPSLPRTERAEEYARFIRDLRVMHARTKPAPLRSPFWPIIEKCLAKQPEARFADIADFRDALQAAANSHGLRIVPKAVAKEDMWAYRDKGNTLMRLGKHTEALAALEKFCAWMPDESATFNKAVCLENLGRLSEALDIYQRSAAGGDYRACVNGANCMRRLGNHEAALEFALRACVLAPDDPDCWITLGNIRYASSSFREAIAAYRAASKLEPTAATPHYNLGLAREQADDLEGAARSFNRFLHFASPLDERRAVATRFLNEQKEHAARPERG